MNFIEKTMMGLRRLGLANSLRVLQYTSYKERMDRKWAPQGTAGKGADQPPRTPGALRAAAAAPRGARFAFERAELEIVFLAQDLARLSWGPGQAPLPYATSPWSQREEASQEPPVEVEETTRGWRLSSPALRLEIGREGEIHFYDPGGALLRVERPPERRGETWTQCAALQAGAQLYGLGERAAGLNLARGDYRLWNRDPVSDRGTQDPLDPLYLTIPVYLALWDGGSYLVFYENSFPGSLSFRAGEANAAFSGGMLRSYFIPGPPAQALERYTELTGRAPLPPRWALGYHQSRWGYRSEADLRAVAQGFAEHEMPLSAIHLDIDYMDGYRVFSVDRKRFPDLPALARQLASGGVRLVAILDPGVKTDPEYRLYREGLERDCFCKLPDGSLALGVVWPGWTAFPDFTSPEARDWWAGQYPALLEAGVAGFWHDMNEPATLAASGDSTIPLGARHAFEGRGGDHLEAHNLYGLLMNAAGYDGLRRARPESRPWLLSRSGWAGMQRYAWNWTGDTDSTWEDLRSTLTMVLGLGLSGVPYSGPDIGGFGGNPPAELYLRWFQLGAFLPFFRTHSAVEYNRREPWVYGEPYTSILRQFLRLRYRLLPYLYTLAWEASRTGQPLCRPLFWDNPQDPALRAVEDAFLLGEALLVAPVLAPGARERSLHLPAGEWYDFWSGERLAGGRQVTLQAPLERIPLLVRAGSLLPLEEAGRMVFRLYAGEGTSALYLDAGDGYGPHRVERFRLSQRGGALELDWETEGSFPFPYSQVEIQVCGLQPGKAELDGAPIPLEDGRLHTAPFKKLRFEPARP